MDSARIKLDQLKAKYESMPADDLTKASQKFFKSKIMPIKEITLTNLEEIQTTLDEFDKKLNRHKPKIRAMPTNTTTTSAAVVPTTISSSLTTLDECIALFSDDKLRVWCEAYGTETDKVQYAAIGRRVEDAWAHNIKFHALPPTWTETLKLTNELNKEYLNRQSIVTTTTTTGGAPATPVKKSTPTTICPVCDGKRAMYFQTGMCGKCFNDKGALRYMEWVVEEMNHLDPANDPDMSLRKRFDTLKMTKNRAFAENVCSLLVALRRINNRPDITFPLLESPAVAQPIVSATKRAEEDEEEEEEQPKEQSEVGSRKRPLDTGEYEHSRLNKDFIKAVALGTLPAAKIVEMANAINQDNNLLSIRAEIDTVLNASQKRYRVAFTKSNNTNPRPGYFEQVFTSIEDAYKFQLENEQVIGTAPFRFYVSEITE